MTSKLMNWLLTGYKDNYIAYYTIGGVIATCSFIAWLTLHSEKTFQYKGKHVVITGLSICMVIFDIGGNAGIGFAVAREYLRQGANITLVARDKTRLDSCRKRLLEELQSVSPGSTQRIEIVSVDLSGTYEPIQKALSIAQGVLGPVSVICNCAGTSYAAEFEELDINEFERLMRINYLSAVYATRAVIGGMKTLPEGRIVVVASQVAQASLHGYTAYGASKWALRGFAEALQMEVKPYNIYVSVSYPPDTDTEGYREEMKTKPEITSKLSESGVFKPDVVAKDIVIQSSKGYFGISTGLDGWLLKQVHPGMSPINSWVELIQQITMASIARLIATFYILSWDSMIAKLTKEKDKHKQKISSTTSESGESITSKDNDDNFETKQVDFNSSSHNTRSYIKGNKKAK